jgi:hypothetical protein
MGGGGYFERTIDRQVGHFPEVLVERLDADVRLALRPMPDGMWQAAGCERCDYYGAAGNHPMRDSAETP